MQQNDEDPKIDSPVAAAAAAFSWPARPNLVADTGDTFNAPLKPSEDGAPFETNNFFKSTQWSTDGTSLLTSSADNILRTFILPQDLLSSSTQRALTPYHTYTLPGPVYATALHPSWSLSDWSTSVYLASVAHQPIRLISLYSTDKIASYPLVNTSTEAFVAPHSLIFDATSRQHTPGSHFIAGWDSTISIFDLNRPGDAPHATFGTIPSRRKKLVGGGVGFKGIVAALDVSADELLAAGAYTRWVGLYDAAGRGGEVGVFRLGDDGGDDGVGAGGGITQVRWTGDARYLLVAERKSDGISVWDVRGTGKRLAWLRGRNCLTMQRMGFDVVDGNVVAGDTEGTVRLWSDVGQTEGIQDPDYQFLAHEDAVSSAVMHPTAAVLATCSGQRHSQSVLDGDYSNHGDEDSDSDSSSDDSGGDDSSSFSSDRTPDTVPSRSATPQHAIDNSLKVWSLYSDLQP